MLCHMRKNVHSSFGDACAPDIQTLSCMWTQQLTFTATVNFVLFGWRESERQGLKAAVSQQKQY